MGMIGGLLIVGGGLAPIMVDATSRKSRASTS